MSRNISAQTVQELGVTKGGRELLLPPRQHVQEQLRPHVGYGTQAEVSAVLIDLAVRPHLHASRGKCGTAWGEGSGRETVVGKGGGFWDPARPALVYGTISP